MEKVKRFLGPWSPVVLLLAMFVFRNSDPAKVLLERALPPEGSLGGVIVPMWQVAPPVDLRTASSRAVLLIQNDDGELPHTQLLCAGCDGSTELSAGVPVSPPPSFLPVVDPSRGSARILDVPLPKDELLALVVADHAGSTLPANERFSYGTSALTRKFAQDLTIRTKNGEAMLRFFYLFVVSLGVASAMHSYRRAPVLKYADASSVTSRQEQSDAH